MDTEYKKEVNSGIENTKRKSGSNQKVKIRSISKKIDKEVKEHHYPKCQFTVLYFFFIFYFFLLFRAAPEAMEFPRLGVESDLQLLACSCWPTFASHSNLGS